MRDNFYSPEIENYVKELFAPEDRILQNIIARTRERNIPEINIDSMEAKILFVLLKSIQAKKAVEVGTLAGYSSVWIARALGPQGKLYTCEYEPKHADAAREAFNEAGLDKNIEVLIGYAVDTLETLNGKGPFDAVFIDADKHNYAKYLDWAERHVRKGGLIIGDNTYLFGNVARPTKPEGDEGARWMGMRRFNERLSDPTKYASMIFPTGEGLTVAVKLF